MIDNFFDDDYHKNDLAEYLNKTPSEVTREEVFQSRFGFCLESKKENWPLELLDEKVAKFCTDTLDSYYSTFNEDGTLKEKNTITSTQAQPSITPEVREACLPAADFLGCVKAFTQPQEPKTNSVQETKPRLDFLGREPIPGYMAVEDRPANTIWYVDHTNVRKVKARGVFGRYITYEYIKRFYQEAVAGTPGYSSTIGSANTYCSGSYGDYSSSMNCSTYAAPEINIPGRQAIPAGLRQLRAKVFIDCLDRKAKWIAISGGEYTKKWKSIEGTAITQAVANTNCSKINSLKASSYMKWANGKPKKDDLLAIDVLPGSTPEMIKNLK